jgi:hypothetical protein
VQRGPDESLFLVPFAEMHRMTSAHKSCTNQSFDRGETEGSKGDALRVKDRGF